MTTTELMLLNTVVVTQIVVLLVVSLDLWLRIRQARWRRRRSEKISLIRSRPRGARTTGTTGRDDPPATVPH